MAEVPGFLIVSLLVCLFVFKIVGCNLSARFSNTVLGLIEHKLLSGEKC